MIDRSLFDLTFRVDKLFDEPSLRMILMRYFYTTDNTIGEEEAYHRADNYIDKLIENYNRREGNSIKSS